MRFLLLVALFIYTVSSSNILLSQEVEDYHVESRNSFISVFLDCNTCDKDYIRNSIPFVNYVRDKELADVHILITTHRAGVSGLNCIILFSGNRDFEDINHSIKYWASDSSTAYEIRKGLVERIKLGLGPFLADTDLADLFTVIYTDDDEIERVEFDDPWNHWVFQIYGGANFSMEKSHNAFNARYGVYADKVSDDWKIRLRPYFNYNVRNFMTEDTIISSRTRRDGFDGYAIMSLNQHWSVGLFSNMLSSTFHNMDFNVDVGPGFEYSIFPYKEATRRAITVAYKMGYSYNDYIEETIFGKLRENLFVQSIRASVSYQQTWGSVLAGLKGSHYFHDFNANRVEFFTTLNLRLFKGFSLSLSGNFDFVNDLVSIPKGDMSLEEVLLQQRRQATTYQAYGIIGLIYTFGSEQQNVVNTRF